jgi:hypothetical protein
MTSAVTGTKSADPLFAERSEARAKLFRKQLRLFPGGKVRALVESVVVDELRIRTLCPTPWSGIDLVWKDAHGNRDGDVFDVEKG